MRQEMETNVNRYSANVQYNKTYSCRFYRRSSPRKDINPFLYIKRGPAPPQALLWRKRIKKRLVGLKQNKPTISQQELGTALLIHTLLSIHILVFCGVTDRYKVLRHTVPLVGEGFLFLYEAVYTLTANSLHLVNCLILKGGGTKWAGSMRSEHLEANSALKFIKRHFRIKNICLNVFLIFNEVALIVSILIILICKLNMHIYYFFLYKTLFTPLLETWYNPKCVEWIFSSKHLIKDAKRSFQNTQIFSNRLKTSL